MAIPDYQEVMLPILKAASLGPVRMPQIADGIADQFSLNEDERTQLQPSGRQPIFYNRLAWAKFHMSKAQLLSSPKRGVFEASDRGKALLAKEPAQIDTETLRTFPEYVAFIEKNKEESAKGITTSETQKTDKGSSLTPEEQMDSAFGYIQDSLKTDLLERVLSQTPDFFELLIVDLLVAMGYGGSHENAAKRLGKTGDGGIDGIIDEDRLGLDRIYVQAKRYALNSSIGRPAIQGFLGSLVGMSASKGVFVTTSSFSSHALDFVRHLPQRIVLIDGERLAELLIEHGVGVRPSRTFTIKRVDDDFFPDE